MERSGRLWQQQADKLKNAGLRVTMPRLAILEALEHDDSHPSAETLYAGLVATHPSLSLSTVYVTLEAFLRTGLVRRVAGGDNRLRVDGTVKDHDHAICRQCGTIFDVVRNRVSLPSKPSTLPGSLEVVSVHLEYEVVCSSCRSSSNI